MLIKNLKGYEAFEHLIGKDLNIYKEFKWREKTVLRLKRKTLKVSLMQNLSVKGIKT